MSALGHQVHGMGKAMEAPVWPAMGEAEVGAVLAHYRQAGRLQALLWHSPRPFSAACLLEAEGGRFLLKRHYARLREVEDLAQEHRFMAHLGARGQAVPPVLDHGAGTALALGPWTYELHGAAAGEDLYRDRQSWTGFLSLTHAHAAGSALARLHLAASDYAAPPRQAAPLVASFTILPAADPLAAAQAYVAQRPAVAAFLAGKPWREPLVALFARQPRGLAHRLWAQPSLWTHNDWHPSNLLWTQAGQVASVFDFGLSTRTCALHDLATAIERCAIPWLDVQEKGQGEGDAQAALALLAGYQAVKPLCDEDRETLLALLPLVHLEFALSEIDYFAGVLGDAAQAEMAWEAYLLGHADWFAGASGQRFLAGLRAGLRA